jgi:hypothetical protein
MLFHCSDLLTIVSKHTYRRIYLTLSRYNAVGIVDIGPPYYNLIVVVFRPYYDALVSSDPLLSETPRLVLRFLAVRGRIRRLLIFCCPLKTNSLIWLAINKHSVLLVFDYFFTNSATFRI